MPKKHSTMSLFAPTYATTLTGGSLQGISLDQNQAVYNDILLYYNQYIKPYYVTRFLGDYFSQLEVQEFDKEHGAEIETKVRTWSVNTSTSTEDTNFIKVLSQLVYEHVLCIRHTFTILNTNGALTTQIAQMQGIIEEQDEVIRSGSYLANKKFQAALLCNLDATISLDLRYWLYIKEHGSPPDGAFDPVKLQKYIYVDNSGNALDDQDYLQYTGLGLENTATNEEQILPSIFTHPLVENTYLPTENIINPDISDNELTPW